MRIGIVGGTGREGKGLAPRWIAAGHEVFIGSRDAARGASVAAELAERFGRPVGGGDNAACVAAAEVVVLAVPYAAHAATLSELAAGLDGKVLVDITVPLQPPKVRQVILPPGESAAMEAQARLGAGVRVVAALHHVGSAELADLDHTPDCDVLVCADDKAARELGMALVTDLGLFALDAGPLRNAIALESLTPVLLHLNRRYGAAASGLRITGIPRPPAG